ncbi:MAG: sugar ABC transporter permease [Armatimonadetes bacterium]|nr:ABC transporter permease subunit [Armatimonadota bacterium]MBS1702554.1 sugar ABC transporter permease [Armatimonadota bacterium]MBS1725982.1 sugar ABC transporter permease [Armatimonadota bacterium]
MKHKFRENLTGYLFISPWLIGFFVFTLYPFCQSFYLSLTRYNIIQDPKFIGLANYRMMLFQDDLFWKSLWVTIRFALVSVPVVLVTGVLLALLLNINVKGMTVFRTIFYLPSIVPAVGTTAIFMWILNPQVGLVNKILAWFGVQGPVWLNDPQWSMWSLVLMAMWGAGGSMVIYLAGLKDIPQYLYEAATLDGASSLTKTRVITLPMLSPVIFFNLVMGVISTFQYFTQAFMISNGSGGPEDSTLFYALYMFQRSWKYLDLGYGSAMAWVLFVIIVAITTVIFRTQRKWVHYGR